MRWVGGVTCNPDCFAGDAVVINVQKGGERDTNDPLIGVSGI